jgi:hypothetical protein
VGRLKLALVRGFSVIEITVTFLLSSLLMMGAYQFATKNSRRTVAVVASLKNREDLNQFFSRANSELNNAIGFPATDATVMANLAPPKSNITQQCQGIYDSMNISLEAPFGEEITQGLMPFPGRTKDQIPGAKITGGNVEWETIDPSILPQNASETSDGFRMVTSHIIEDAPIQLLSYTGNKTFFPIAVKDTGSINLRVGDFAVVSDDMSRDLIRITNITPGNGNLDIYADSDISIWNSPAPSHNYNFGKGVAIIRKASVIDYAHDPVTKTVYRDNHVADDGFRADQGTFLGVRGLARQWVPVLTGVEKFRINYDVVADKTKCSNTGILDDAIVSIRTPRATLSTWKCCWHNQVAYPGLKGVRFEVSLAASTKGEPVNQGPAPTPIPPFVFMSAAEGIKEPVKDGGGCGGSACARLTVTAVPQPTAVPTSPGPTPGPTAVPSATPNPAGTPTPVNTPSSFNPGGTGGGSN